MLRSRLVAFVATLVAWMGALAVVAGARGPGSRSGALAAGLATATALLAGGYATLLAFRRAPRPPRATLGRLAVLGAPVALAIIAVSGGLRSPAVLALALCALGLSRERGTRRALTMTSIAFALLLGTQLLAVGRPALPDLVNAIAILLAVGTLPVWLGARAAASLGEARKRSEQLERFLTGPRVTPERLRAMPSELRPDAKLTQEQLDDRRQFEAIAAVLRDLRELLGAEEVVFWRFSKSRDALVASAWTGAGTAGPANYSEAWIPFVQWAAQERLVQCDTPTGLPTLAAAPVIGEGLPLGAVSAWAPSGLTVGREYLQHWLPRHATTLARLTELLETRREFSRQNVQTAALLSAAQRFQSHRSIHDLGAAICATALQVTSGSRAALVRWHADGGYGTVETVNGDDGVQPGMRVSADSLVGQMCASGLPQVLEDARHALRASRIFGDGETPRETGSIGIYPLKRELDVVGAIVIESSQPGAVLIKDVRHVRLLSALAVASLETMWEIDAVTERARTDQLTGLANRHHFEEQLTRLFAEHDRYEHPLSLIVADIDYFKKVNDTYGHDAGDAVLRAIAVVFREGVRAVDVCARYGGEEIAVLLPETGTTGALELAERLRRAVEGRVVHFAGKSIPVTASFGVATFPDGARSRDAFFPAADRALYQAKRDGRNCVKAAPPIVSGKTT